MNRLERIKGCLLGGAVGDALGAPVEFLEWSAIEAKFGPQGIIDFAPAYGITGATTDDTQMMLFTAEGLLRAYVRGSSRGTCHVPSIIHHALLRWLVTQDYPTGYLAAGLFADILQRIVDRQDSLEHAVTQSMANYGQKPGMEETHSLIERVLFFFYEGYQPTPQRIGELGGGWVAEEALAIGLWCALFADSLESGVITSVNHGGDSDSTGLIAGHLLGAQYGAAAIPARWLIQLELREVIEQMADDIDRVPREYCGVGGEFDEQIERAYPGY
ncbi:ADP-ribosylglycohydrolase family protein [Pseudomonas marginalis]|uniref:ADP-ribosylglycohydrolase family protein n=1 Tax=Pseudomonas marginalis TaxID=298 RepID=UPI001F35B5D7|nr:ADP-ribosylglycohydrolase family protein [Pseudomonas marginalis]MCF5663666.1 ADP-ribosylglycohydrolase family protein [Pseudomonas marginalis]